MPNINEEKTPIKNSFKIPQRFFKNFKVESKNCKNAYQQYFIRFAVDLFGQQQEDIFFIEKIVATNLENKMF